jgi:hypothetical protein
MEKAREATTTLIPILDEAFYQLGIRDHIHRMNDASASGQNIRMMARIAKALNKTYSQRPPRR